MAFYSYTAIFSSFAVILLLMKLNKKKVLYFDVLIDATSSVFLMAVFFGSFAGMMAAVIGGALISITLWFMKRTIGYCKPVRHRLWFRWQEVKPR